MPRWVELLFIGVGIALTATGYLGGRMGTLAGWAGMAIGVMVVLYALGLVGWRILVKKWLLDDEAGEVSIRFKVWRRVYRILHQHEITHASLDLNARSELLVYAGDPTVKLYLATRSEIRLHRVQLELIGAKVGIIAFLGGRAVASIRLGLWKLPVVGKWFCPLHTQEPAPKLKDSIRRLRDAIKDLPRKPVKGMPLRFIGITGLDKEIAEQSKVQLRPQTSRLWILEFEQGCIIPAGTETWLDIEIEAVEPWRGGMRLAGIESTAGNLGIRRDVIVRNKR